MVCLTLKKEKTKMKILFLLTTVLCFAITTKIILRKIENLKINQIDFKDCSPPKFYITGDKHRNFKDVNSFCQQMNTRKNDVLIILGDSGFNFYGDIRDDELKEKVSKLPITLFCIHGNKENRPENIGTYGIRNCFGAKVYYEPKYPNLLFAIDGEVYNFGGRKYIVVGGAHSVDKQYCLECDKEYWDDEMPSDEIKQKVELKLRQRDNKIYGILTHTCPLKYLPTEMFISTRNKKKKK